MTSAEYDLRYPDYEQPLCLMVAWFLAGEHDELVAWTKKADAEQPGGVDLLADTAAIPSLEPRRRFAIEHTLLEVYPDELDESRRFLALLLPLEDRLGAHLPGFFQLSIGLRVLRPPVAWAHHDSLRMKIARWVTEVAPKLKPGEVELGTPADVPFVVQLRCRDRVQPGLRIARFIEPGANLAEWRADAVKKAFMRKVLKLSREHTDGRRTVRLLESANESLTSIEDVAPLVEAVASAAANVPDEILFVETNFRLPPWDLWIVKRDASYFPGIAGYEQTAPHATLVMFMSE